MAGAQAAHAPQQRANKEKERVKQFNFSFIMRVKWADWWIKFEEFNEASSEVGWPTQTNSPIHSWIAVCAEGWVGCSSLVVGYGRCSGNAPQKREDSNKQPNHNQFLSFNQLIILQLKKKKEFLFFFIEEWMLIGAVGVVLFFGGLWAAGRQGLRQREDQQQQAQPPINNSMKPKKVNCVCFLWVELKEAEVAQRLQANQ